MGQKTNPIANRLGIIRGWDSNWYGGKNYKNRIKEDYHIRQYIEAHFSKSSISHIYIESTLKMIILTITSSRPGIIIGKGGKEIDKLKESLKKMTEKDVNINIYDIRNSSLDARLVAKNLSQQISNRISYKKAIKVAIYDAKRLDVEGIKIQISGRLNGAEMSRTESYKEGRIPLSTLRAYIDYAIDFAQTSYGIIGIKVWIMKGEIYEKKTDLSPLIGLKKQQRPKSKKYVTT
ncbi:30S ribosomal protein S3 [Candidatus Walczuchella monophlebidarum]|uniref:Small ribosomal subunit protein uS3 n=1 Tax=Candidatus Walczuchella monophlebidarum TaxID=1415657 RepID=A0A068DNL2_9FLAO|nr:30S ribosomal protein S3 [Candidatus Walczuchella monophlebidarum]AID37350.1 ribosomal protein S3 [Candidatus Walczuchella monophlebidarum]